MRSLALVVVVVVVAAVLGAATASADAPPFGPFDAGAKRDVVRQGSKGLPRRAHPLVGEAAKVPGEGPPPPPLHLSRDIPEGVLAGVNKIEGPGLSSNPLYLAALLYSNVITKIDGPRCQHLPTCSRFANQAVARHGALGILMGLDRVIQPGESSSVRNLPEIEAYGGIRHYDPVENYEFWKPERFTGFPAKTAEQPLELSPLTTSTSTAHASVPSPKKKKSP